MIWILDPEVTLPFHPKGHGNGMKRCEITAFCKNCGIQVSKASSSNTTDSSFLCDPHLIITGQAFSDFAG